MTSDTDFSELSGYSPTRELLAQRYNRGGRSVFIVALPIHLIPTHLPIPDPAEPFEDNRRVMPSHAKKFGEFWRLNSACVTPPLLMDTPFPISQRFRSQLRAGNVEFGVVELPHNSAEILRILDGQHRILGWQMINSQMHRELASANEDLMRARSANEVDSIDYWQSKIDSISQEINRMSTEYATVEIIEGLTPEEHRQVFADIANNARGITRSTTVGFDQRLMANRVANELSLQLELLQGRVDTERASVRGSNPNLIAASNLADVVHHCSVGIGGRFSSNRENTWQDNRVEEVSRKFFEVIVKSFPDLKSVEDNDLSPGELREKSLLGSATILRILAGVFFELAVDETEHGPAVTSVGARRAGKLFKALNPLMNFEEVDGEKRVSAFWQSLGTGFFPEETSTAPSSRRQDLIGLTSALVDSIDSFVASDH